MTMSAASKRRLSAACDRPVQRLPALRQLRVVDRGVGGQALGFHHQRLGAGERLQLLCPPRDARLRLREPGRRGLVGARARFLLEHGELRAQAAERIRPVGRGERGDPFVHAALEPRARRLLGLLAVEARLQRAARGVAAFKAGGSRRSCPAPASGD